MRLRYDKHETQLIRPVRTVPSSAARRQHEAPYKPNVDEALQADVDLGFNNNLLLGWTINEYGYMTLGETHDDWQIQGNYW